jgi:lysine 6-dehydrogenase
MRVLVLGAGLQGAACAFDLLRTAGVEEVRLADLAVDVLPPYLLHAGCGRLVPIRLDARDREAVRRAMRGCDVALSAVPYYLNASLAAWAVEAGVHFSDLGGNAEILAAQRRLDAEARARGVAVVPDCGLAPGLVNILAELGIRRFDRVESVKLFVGGLPQHPEPPLHYQVVYSLEGVLDYYTTPSWILRDGRRVQVPALSEVEMVEFDEPVGRLEAFHTAGGLSSMAERYEGRIASLEYKTLRYPGHAAIMTAIRALGFLDLEPVEVGGIRVVPREVAIALMKPRLTRPDGRDLVVVRVVVRGERGGRSAARAWEVVDYYDATHGLTAMMRTTGYSLAVTGVMQARGAIPAGVHTAAECVPAEPYLEALAARGITVRERPAA